MSAPVAGPITPQLRTVLRSSVPIAVGAVGASAAGLLWSGAYAAETAGWAAQGRGQDAVNLVVYPVLLVLAWRAARGSLLALLAWAGLVLYSAYSYLLYAGWVHFGPLFPVYVATFGLSVFGLVGALGLVDPRRLRAAFRSSAPERGVGAVLAGLGVLFAALWLAEIVPPLLRGTVPSTLADAGLVSNPVWVLDLGVVLPAMVVAGVLLRRGRPLGHLLAVPLLVFGIAMGVAIVGMVVSLAVAGEARTIGPAIAMVAVVAVESAALVALARHLRPGVRPVDVVRAGSSEAPRGGVRDERSTTAVEPHDLPGHGPWRADGGRGGARDGASGSRAGAGTGR